MRFKLKNIAKGLLFCWMMTLFSCENDSSVTNEIISKDNTIIKAKEWLENNKPNLEALEYTKTIDWNNAILLNNDGEQAIEVPLILVDGISTNVVEDKKYKTHMRLLLIKDLNSTYKVFDIVYTTQDESFNNNDKSFNILDIGSGYSGYITIQKSDNKIAFSGKYENGELSGLHNFDQRRNITSRLVCTYYVTVGPYTTCSNWVWYPDYGTGDLPRSYMPGISGPIFQNGLPPVDPCNAAKTVTFISTNSGYVNAKAAIIKASADGNEHSITLGAAVSGVYTQSPMNNGGPNGVAVNQSLSNPIFSIHNHPNNTPLSTGDIYTAVTLNTKFTGFTTSIIITGGQTYAIMINDITKAQNFVKNYPPDLSPNYPPEFPNFIFDQIDAMKDYMGYTIEGRTSGIAFILDKYNSGITLMKQDTNGKFNRIKNQETTNADGSKRYLAVPCN